MRSSTKHISCVFMLTSIEKNPAFLSLVFGPPLKHLLTYTWCSVQKTCLPAVEMEKSARREEAQKEALQAFYDVARHEHLYLVFYKTIYKGIPMLNIMISYFILRLSDFPKVAKILSSYPRAMLHL